MGQRRAESRGGTLVSVAVCEYREGVSGELQTLVDRDFGQSVVINYGNSHLDIGGHTLLLNPPEAVALCVDKLKALQHMHVLEIPVPDHRDVGYPRILKSRYHRGGRGTVIVRRETDGYRLSRNTVYYAEVFIPVEKEYRVHVVGDSTCVRLKTGGTGEIRSRRYGYRFMYVDNVPSAVRQVAVEAVRALGLDFGAADVGYTNEGKVVVFEVNSAPTLTTESVVKWYARGLANLIERRLRI